MACATHSIGMKPSQDCAMTQLSPRDWVLAELHMPSVPCTFPFIFRRWECHPHASKCPRKPLQPHRYSPSLKQYLYHFERTGHGRVIFPGRNAGGLGEAVARSVGAISNCRPACRSWCRSTGVIYARRRGARHWSAPAPPCAAKVQRHKSSRRRVLLNINKYILKYSYDLHMLWDV